MPARTSTTREVLQRCLLALLFTGLILVLSGGCTRQVFMSEKVFEDATNQLSYQLENDPSAGVRPTSAVVDAPPIVDYPDRPARFMTLPEAIAIALENGTTSSNNQFSGTVDDSLVGLGRGPLNGQSERVRVLAMDPAIAQTNIEASLARFDAKWVTTMSWTVTDNLQNGLSNFQNGQSANFNTTLVKALASGGVANFTFGALNPGPFSGSYTSLSNPPPFPSLRANNIYNIPVTLGIEQPLWQNFGVGINQLLNQVAPIQGITMPGQAAAYYNNNSRLPLAQGPNFAGLATQGILLARLNFDLKRAEFERHINSLLANTEVAYWRLYQSYGQLFSWDEALRSALTGWRTAQANAQAGRGKVHDVPLTKALYEEFRGERLKALGQVLEGERHLRGILGIPAEDGSRIVPVSAPTMAPYQPNWDAAVEDALAQRPELIMARENLRNLQYNLIISKNFLKPDLRAVAFYQPTGWGTRLDGNGTLPAVDPPPPLGTGAIDAGRTNNALRSLADGDFVNWTVGLTLNVPLGWRLEHAGVRSARLQLAQAYYVLEDQEERAKRYLTQQYQKVNEWYRRIEIARSERKSYEETVKVYWKLIEAGVEPFTPGNQAVVDAERRLALARLKEFEAIAEYNSTLCRFELAKGTLQQHDNVAISEGPLPQAVQVRAVEQERIRTRALVLQERDPAPLMQPGMLFEQTRGGADAVGAEGAPVLRDFDDGGRLRPEPIPIQPKEFKQPENLPAPPKELNLSGNPRVVDRPSSEGDAMPPTQGTIVLPEESHEILFSTPPARPAPGSAGNSTPSPSGSAVQSEFGSPPPLPFMAPAPLIPSSN